MAELGYIVTKAVTHEVLSTDPRPEAALGDTLREIDTNRIYVYTADGWVHRGLSILGTENVGDFEAAVLARLDAIGQQLSFITGEPFELEE
jgi:hypothetical protein